MPPSNPSGRATPGRAGRAVALLAAAAQIVAIFLPWTADDVTALEAGLRSAGEAAEQPTVAASLVVLAALPAVAALLGDVGWPRAVAGAGTGGLVLYWLALGPDGHLVPGVLVALAAAVAHIGAAALATGPGAAEAADAGRRRQRPPGSARAHRDRTAGGGRGRATGAGPDAGYRLVSHTADVIVEAWGPTRAACFGEAVRGLVASFAETTDVAASSRHETDLASAGDDEDLLVDLLDEVIYLADAHGVVPVGGRFRDRDDGGLAVVFDVADVEAVRPSGAVPKATTYHGLEVVREAGRWRCRATIDV